jgi:hypothetical protein
MQMICHSDLTTSLFPIVLTHAKINRFVARLFDKGPPTTWPASVPTPYCSENPPPTLSITVFFFVPLYTYG